MRSRFDEELRHLNEELLKMAGMAQNAISDAITALFTQDTDTARRIMDGDETIDQEQKKVEDICFRLLIRQQPVARDLRVITAAMKMVTDIERIGDHAADISELTVMMAGSPYVLQQNDIRKMASETIEMLMHAIGSYVEKDILKANEVITHDDVVDELFLKVKSELIEVMKQDTDHEEQAADLLMVNKYLERIGDHAVNIAEWVIFSLNEKQPEEPAGH